MDLAGYKALIAERFANSEIADTVRRLCLDGSNRQPKFIVPTIRDLLSQGRDASGLILLSALWCRYCWGEDEAGRPIPPNDPDWEALTKRARAAREDPLAWLSMPKVYGDLASDPRFAEGFAAALHTVWAEGSHVAIARYIAGG
jgi:mannitol 2-dehydrogenase